MTTAEALRSPASSPRRAAPFPESGVAHPLVLVGGLTEQGRRYAGFVALDERFEASRWLSAALDTLLREVP